APRAPFIIEKKLYKMEQLPYVWHEFVKFLSERAEYLHSFLSTIDRVEISGNKLLFVTDFKFYEDWVLEKNNKMRIMNTVSRYVDVPPTFDIGVKVIEKIPDDIREKIMRRYDDLTK
ncbi:MAG TPA: hypothetical protein DD426_02405, partial [Clostridiaceae bacterium]|nr:hypothetical protein [Clostridiaceae bacterium]